MKLVRGAWKLLVGIKDGLVLLFMLLFFGLLFAALSARPNPAAITDGALVMDLSGTVVEQPDEVDPFAALGGGEVLTQHRLRDLVRALDKAKDDGRVKAVVLDLDRFLGGYPATVGTLGEAIGRVRASGKPVLAFATAYSDSSYALAAHASEIWVDPFGGALFAGPGGSRLYYKGLLDRLGVNAHVYRVGTYKSAVEPYVLNEASPAAKQADTALYGALFGQWVEMVKKARPKADLARYVAQPDTAVLAANGDIAKANLAAGIVDKLGDRLAFGKRVAAIAGASTKKGALPGSYREIRLKNWIAANPAPTTGDAIGVITIAGEIVGGESGQGTAGGDTVSQLLLKGLAEKKLKALVVRVDSPGGSVLASEQMRQAILEAKRRGLPVVVSMGGLAASGGYWVSTPGDVIFAEPNTITGSIGIFGVLPTFEGTLAKIGVNADGVQTTPLTGQPDVLDGTNATIDRILQSSIEQGYRRFVGLVAQSRKLPVERVDEIGQGRVWDGGTARQLKLVDRFGGIDDAIAEAARRAKLDPAKVHALYLEKEPGWEAQFAELLARDDDEKTDETETDLMSRLAAERRAVFARALGDMRGLLNARGAVQARCLECAALAPAVPRAEDRALARMIIEKGL
ncbi:MULTISPECIES: signal peptide peptidase SppA [unclassified Sphingomonas]|uniref:signal peptide peptidase SppA n=1 Tax=unclassified Sphingomonas TaxID=196159 RepID=UPI00082F77B6|nr:MULTISPECIES: signal peptide peptidase SppA [unclassified Sphingomonas]